MLLSSKADSMGSGEVLWYPGCAFMGAASVSTNGQKLIVSQKKVDFSHLWEYAIFANFYILTWPLGAFVAIDFWYVSALSNLGIRQISVILKSKCDYDS